jgi:hypothetical protein
MHCRSPPTLTLKLPHGLLLKLLYKAGCYKGRPQRLTIAQQSHQPDVELRTVRNTRPANIQVSLQHPISVIYSILSALDNKQHV